MTTVIEDQTYPASDNQQTEVSISHDTAPAAATPAGQTATLVTPQPEPEPTVVSVPKPTPTGKGKMVYDGSQHEPLMSPEAVAGRWSFQAALAAKILLPINPRYVAKNLDIDYAAMTNVLRQMKDDHPKEMSAEQADLTIYVFAQDNGTDPASYWAVGANQLSEMQASATDSQPPAFEKNGALRIEVGQEHASRIGRGPDNWLPNHGNEGAERRHHNQDLQLEEKYGDVSKLHCALEVDEDGNLAITDYSRNGTRVEAGPDKAVIDEAEAAPVAVRTRSSEDLFVQEAPEHEAVMPKTSVKSLNSVPEPAIEPVAPAKPLSSTIPAKAETDNGFKRAQFDAANPNFAADTSKEDTPIYDFLKRQLGAKVCIGHFVKPEYAGSAPVDLRDLETA